MSTPPQPLPPAVPPPPQGPPPPPWAPFPAPARPTRPSAWWFAVGGALLVTGAVCGVGLLVWTLLALFRTDTALPVDGRAHAVSVATDGDRMLWYDTSRPRPECTVSDTATGEAITLRPPGARLTRSIGSVSWLALHRFAPGSGELEVTCTEPVDRPGNVEVEIGPAPRFGSLFSGIALAVLVPTVLGLAGLLLLALTAVRYATGDPRPRRTDRS